MFAKQLGYKKIRLEKLLPEHVSILKETAMDERLWTFIRPPHQPIDTFLDAYLDRMLHENQDQTRFTYVVIDDETEEFLGSTSYYNYFSEDKRLCMGYTWYQAHLWGKGLNPIVKYMVLEDIFERMQWNRVGFHVDSRNDRSLSAMTYLGAKKEGVLRQHKIVQGDFVRDTVLFSILRSEWPSIKKGLLNRLDSI